MKKLMTLLLTMMLVLSLCACGASSGAAGVVVADGATLGEGATSFTLEIVDLDGNSVSATINTDESKVGDALQTLGIIDGEVGSYGLYIKSVNGITADYDKDGTYWAFYINGEYAMTGADMTKVEAGATYTFAVERG